MKIIRNVSVFIMSAMLFLSGCSASNLLSKTEKVNIDVIVKKRDYNYWAVVEMGAEAAGKEFGINVQFDGPEEEEDIDGQIKLVEDAIESGADAIVLAASDYTRLVPVAEKAVSEGIPVIIIDSNIQSDKMTSFVGTDNVDAGKMLGGSLVEKVGEECDIVIMSFIKGAATANQREAGLLISLDKYPGINVKETLYCNSDEALAKKLTLEALERNPDIDAFVCLNAYAAVGTAQAIEESGLAGTVKVMGFDSTPEEISFMEKDVIQSLVIQNPFSMGYLGVKYAWDTVNKIEVPETVNTGSKVIDKENMYLPENQKLLFPFTDTDSEP